MHFIIRVQKEQLTGVGDVQYGRGAAGGQEQGRQSLPGHPTCPRPAPDPGVALPSPGLPLGRLSFRRMTREVRSVLFKLCSFFKADVVHVYK